jgi:acyl-coenzyme A thioesterase PaaI-like protein
MSDARDVAAELRAIAELLATRDVDDDTLTVSRAHLDAVRATLEGAPVRPRWYDVNPSDRDASRAYHDEFGPLRGRASVVAPPLVFASTVDGRVVATARCGVLDEGPPRLVHGGIIAACFDEVLAVAQRDAGVNGLTTELTVRYRRPITIDTDLVFTAWIESDDGRRAIGRAECTVDANADPADPAADATATFVRPRM